MVWLDIDCRLQEEEDEMFGGSWDLDGDGREQS